MSKRKYLSHFFYPHCKENECNGLLNIKFNDNFTLDFICDKDSSHKKSNIFFKTFERYYLNEKKIDVCSKCFSPLDDTSYKCIICEKLYCINCFTKDKHIKKNLANLKVTSKKCLIHNKDLTLYCSHCKKYICIYCLRDVTDKSHNFINLIDLIPSNDKINNLINKIKEKNKFYEEIINSIDQWQNAIISRINQLKQNLRDEISLLEKICLNFNYFYINNTYLSLFGNIDKYISRKNELLYKFNNSTKIEEKTKILFKLSNINNDISNTNEIILEKVNYKLDCYKMEGLFEKVNNKIYLELNENKLRFLKLNEDKKFKYCNKFHEFREKIYSVSISPEKQQIYACLSNKKMVKILNYTDENSEIMLSNEQISDEIDSIRHFNKCIDIANNRLATSDDKYIIIWIRTKNSNYFKLRKFIMFYKTSDILLANSNHLFASVPKVKNIYIYNINNLILEKKIHNIDPIDSSRCLLKYKEYIIINCVKGIALIFAKTEELFQYIENYIECSSNKEIFVDDLNKICILNNNISQKKFVSSIIRLDLVCDSLKPIEAIKTISKYNINNIIYLINGLFVICEDGIYSIEEFSE